jgi:hypothetical protein
MPTGNDVWMRLCALLDDDAEIATGVAALTEDALRWSALIDGLDDAGVLAYLDAQDTGVEVADALAGVPRVFRTGADLDVVGDTDELDAAIAQADGILAEHGLRVVYLEEDSDAYPLVVVPIGNADEIVELAARIGREARVFL